jgi:HEAT repeat protein
VTATKEEIGARVDALAQAHTGDEFVAAAQRLAGELDADDRAVLQQVLLERAADEADFQQALRQRIAVKGWFRRTFGKLERLWSDDRAAAIADAIEAGPEGEAWLARETEALGAERGRAALVLDELSRHKSGRVRAWVPGTAVAILDDGAKRLVLSLTRDRDRSVRDAAVSATIELGPEAAKPIVPDLRRRLHAEDAPERIAAMAALARIGDRTALPVIRERAEAAELPEERDAARAALLVLEAPSP